MKSNNLFLALLKMLPFSFDSKLQDARREIERLLREIDILMKEKEKLTTSKYASCSRGLGCGMWGRRQLFWWTCSHVWKHFTVIINLHFAFFIIRFSYALTISFVTFSAILWIFYWKVARNNQVQWCEYAGFTSFRASLKSNNSLSSCCFTNLKKRL